MYVVHTPKIHYLLTWKSFNIFIKIRINIVPTCFGLRPIVRELLLHLAKITLMLKQSVKLHRYVLCGDVAACYHIMYNDVILPSVLT